MSYQALICRLSNVKKHSNADRLNTASANGYQVIVGLDRKDGDLGVFFGEGGELSHEMCHENNLYSHKELNKNPEVTGFFGNNRRVKAQKFRGEISEGFWADLNILSWAGDVSSLKEGDQFDSFGGYKICQKYYTPATKAALGSGQKKEKKVLEKYDYSMLVKHYDTKQVRDNLKKFPIGAVLYFTEKCHGTSGRTGYICTQKKLSGFKKWWNNHFKTLRFEDKEWIYVSGTRNVVIRPNEHYHGGFYADTNFRGTVHETIKKAQLYKGETLYYEIVGFTENDQTIMPSHNIEDKTLAKKYGSKMTYKYGCEVGQHKILVYRITMINKEGQFVEYSWPQVVARCKELNLQTVPSFGNPIVYEGDTEKLLDILRRNSDGSSLLDKDHIREGVVMRVEHEEMFDVFKYKGWVFCDLEGIRKNSEDYIDIEEVA